MIITDIFETTACERQTVWQKRGTVLTKTVRKTANGSLPAARYKLVIKDQNERD